MKKFATRLLTIALLTSFASSAFAQYDKKQTIEASYVMALDRNATSSEVNYWMGQPLKGDFLGQMVETHRGWLQSNPNEKRTMIRKAYKDAYGIDPSNAEVEKNMQMNYHYTDWINNHLAWIGKSDAEKTQVYTRAYNKILGRNPSNDELKYWKQGAYAYYLVAGCLQTCKQSSSSGSCLARIISPSSSSVLQVPANQPLAMSAAKINEASAAKMGNTLVASGGGNLVASGGGNLVASGGGNISALIASGGGN